MITNKLPMRFRMKLYKMTFTHNGFVMGPFFLRAEYTKNAKLTINMYIDKCFYLY